MDPTLSGLNLSVGWPIETAFGFKVGRPSADQVFRNRSGGEEVHRGAQDPPRCDVQETDIQTLPLPAEVGDHSRKDRLRRDLTTDVDGGRPIDPERMRSTELREGCFRRKASIDENVRLSLQLRIEDVRDVVRSQGSLARTPLHERNDSHSTRGINGQLGGEVAHHLVQSVRGLILWMEGQGRCTADVNDRTKYGEG